MARPGDRSSSPDSLGCSSCMAVNGLLGSVPLAARLLLLPAPEGELPLLLAGEPALSLPLGLSSLGLDECAPVDASSGCETPLIPWLCAGSRLPISTTPSLGRAIVWDPLLSLRNGGLRSSSPGGGVGVGSYSHATSGEMRRLPLLRCEPCRLPNIGLFCCRRRKM